MAKKNRDIHMSTHRFLEHVRSGYEANQRYCFILGSGASRNSNIKTGEELIEEWKTYLREKELQHPGYIQECAADCQLEEKDWKRFLDPNYQAKNEDYFSYYDLRFAGMPVQAYHYLQKLMENASPSFGFYALAALMENTENKLVITTNFDSLVEDTLFLYHAKHPLVVGHESLASFIEYQENTGRPIVAKVHRDLYLRPLNRKQELKVLDERWKDPLQSVLTRYIPIVIGYAGGDQTLMNLLEKMNLRTVYWCSLKNPESERIEAFLRKQPNRYLVDIKGFDEIMFELFGCLIGNADFDDPVKRIKEFVDQRCREYSEQLKKMSEPLLDAKSEDRSSDVKEQEGFSDTSSAEIADEVDKSAALQLLKKFSEEKPTDSAAKASQLRLDAALEMGNNKPDAALILLASALNNCRKAIRNQPDNSDYQELLSDIYGDTAYAYKAMADYNNALEYYEKERSIKEKVLGKGHLDTVTTYYNMASVYRTMGDYVKALKSYEKALKIREPVLGRENPEIAETYNNIAGVYFAMGEYPKAIASLEKAIKICEIKLGKKHPNTATTYSNLARIYRAMGDYTKSMESFEKALEIRENVLGSDHPSTATTYNNIGVLYNKMERYHDAEDYLLRAFRIRLVKLDPGHPNTRITYDWLSDNYDAQHGETESFLPWLRGQLNDEENRALVELLGQQ